MQYNKFFYFSCFSKEKQQELEPYFSPEQESSLFKGVPVDRMEEFKQIAKTVLPDSRIRVRFRGPRHDCMRLTTLKRDARSAVIYAYKI